MVEHGEVLFGVAMGCTIVGVRTLGVQALIPAKMSQSVCDNLSQSHDHYIII